MDDAIYISLDALEIENLYDLIKELYENYKFKIFLLDEIHYYEEYEKDLKKIF